MPIVVEVGQGRASCQVGHAVPVRVKSVPLPAPAVRGKGTEDTHKSASDSAVLLPNDLPPQAQARSEKGVKVFAFSRGGHRL